MPWGRVSKFRKGRVMKVLWVEDHPKACELLTQAGLAATRKRLPVDLVIAASLMEAERRLRLERFDLVMLDLRLPDSIDEDATITRISNMGEFRLGIVSASERRQDMADFLCSNGRNCAPRAIAKEDLTLADFSRRPETFLEFLTDVMDSAAAQGAAA